MAAEWINNPLCPHDSPDIHDNRFPDPHIKIFTNPDTGREAMYVYVGHDEGRDQFIMRDWYVMWSEDLVHWSCRKSLDRRDTYLDDESVNCWACDCVQSPFDGRYYLYYSNGGESTGVAVSDRPDGPFRDARGKTPILPPGITPTNSYDPDIILPDEEDDRAWILFGSDWTDHYWAMQLAQNMVEVVPGTARKVPVYPADGTPTELLGVLRSDQAEAFRYGGWWYLYWAGRYATSRSRLGPYIFRGNIGADIPHYPDGRAFIDHGSFVQWNGQWFYAVSQGLESWSYRQSWLMYLHVCDDGTLMFDEEIRKYGVGHYDAAWEKIEAEWYMRLSDGGLTKVELRDGTGHLGFAIAQTEGEHTACYPHVHGLAQNMALTLRVHSGGAAVTVLFDDMPCGQTELPAAPGQWQDVRIPLTNPAGVHHLALRFTGCVTLDSFRLTPACPE